MRNLIVCLVIVSVRAISLPTYFPKCSNSDSSINECILKASIDLKPYLKSGIVEMDIPSLDKIQTVSPYLKHKAKNSNFNISFTSIVFYNLTDYNLKDVEFSPSELLLKGNLTYERLLFTSTFGLNGVLAGYPATGSGKFKGYLKNLAILFVIKANTVQIDGLNHCTIADVKIVFESDGLYGTIDAPTSEKFALSTDVISKEPSAMGKITEFLFAEVFKKHIKDYLNRLCSDVPYESLVSNNL